jgi:hypothetical protein
MVTEIFLHENVFWNVTPFVWQKFTDVLKGPAPPVFLIETRKVWGSGGKTGLCWLTNCRLQHLEKAGQKATEEEDANVSDKEKRGDKCLSFSVRLKTSQLFTVSLQHSVTLPSYELPSV